jgi:NADP-dependent 3-hydroxy acid dehydrogenase YdfG
MIDINVKGLLYVSREVIPLMVKQKSGIIINLSSIAGKEVYPQGNVYCASKHAVEALTLGMRMDLNQYGIKVGSVAPGMVDTEFSCSI